MGVVKPASEARAVSAVADGVGCGLCAPAARGRGRGAGDSGAERGEGTGQREGAERDSIADGTALRNIVGEEVAAALRTSEIRLGGSFFV